MSQAPQLTWLSRNYVPPADWARPGRSALPSRWNKGQSDVLQMDRSVTTPLLNHQDPVFHRHGSHPTANRMVEIYKTPPHWGLHGEIHVSFHILGKELWILSTLLQITVMVNCLLFCYGEICIPVHYSVGRSVCQSSLLILLLASLVIILFGEINIYLSMF